MMPLLPVSNRAVSAGRRSTQHQFAKAVDKVRRQTIMPNQESHVDWSVERIEEQVQVLIFGQFATLNPPAEGDVGFSSAGPEEALSEGGDEVLVALPSAKDGRNNSSTWTAKDFDELTHLLAHVRSNEARVGEVELSGRAAGECIRDENSLVRPPAINGSLTNACMGRHRFNRQVGKAVLSQKLQRAVQDG